MVPYCINFIGSNGGAENFFANVSIAYFCQLSFELINLI